MGSETKKTKAQKKLDRERNQWNEWLSYQLATRHNHLMFPVEDKLVNGFYVPICEKCWAQGDHLSSKPQQPLDIP